MSALSLSGLLGQLARQVLDRLDSPPAPASPAGEAVPTPQRPPDAGTPGLDGLLPPLVNGWPRVHLNDRFGGLERGGVHAAYDAGGHEVRVAVRRATSGAQAVEMVARAPSGPGHAAWHDGALWYFASGGTVLGDEDPTFGPGDVEAFEAFIAAFRRRSS